MRNPHDSGGNALLLDACEELSQRLRNRQAREREPDVVAEGGGESDHDLIRARTHRGGAGLGQDHTALVGRLLGQ